MTTNAVDKCLFAISAAEEIEVERELRRPAPFTPAWPSQASQAPRTTHQAPGEDYTGQNAREAAAWYTYQAALAEKLVNR